MVWTSVNLLEATSNAQIEMATPDPDGLMNISWSLFKPKKSPVNVFAVACCQMALLVPTTLFHGTVLTTKNEFVAVSY